ncbi:MAG TPA: caspase family protein [Thermoanaerobaculia bacterium]|nr:caspase family protein [Thermoanaerobaculia bacterium]
MRLQAWKRRAGFSPPPPGMGGLKPALRFALLLLLGTISVHAQQSADDLLLVDCRLPPKMRRVGGRTYPMAQPPRRTTAVDCRIRGGEYTVYDRGNYQTSLKLWLAEAEKGSAEAAYYVGKIYEGGLGTPPDYAAAAKWYQQAAAKGHSASQYSLGTLYEQGLGVPADKTKAFNLYRGAAGLSGDYVIVETTRYQELEKAAEELALREQEVEELQRQLDDAKQRDQSKIRELQQKLDAQQARIESHKKEIARIQGLVRTYAPAGASKALAAPKGGLGRYYALVIGNSKYDSLPPLPNAENDAKAMANILRDAYGFEVTLLLNARGKQILTTLYELSQNLAENDNLVVFYAGHGRRDLRNRRGWWLPVDATADASARTNWLPNQDVSDRLALIPSRHILVLADGSYVGDITRGAPQPDTSSMTPAQWTKYVEASRRKKARLALASGTDGASSRFTNALIGVLQKQKGVVPASRIHREVVNTLTAGDRVTSAVPTFAPLQSAFHDGADFLFQRK